MSPRRILPIFLLLSLAACGGDPSPREAASISSSGSREAEGGNRQARGGRRVVTDDDRLARIGADFPGFAGIELDHGAGTLIIYSSKAQPDVEGLHDEIVRVFDDELERLEPKVVIRSYSFRQLKSWYDDFGSHAFSFEGVNMTDINESTNTIDIGVDDVDRDGPEIYEAARRSGIPDGVVRVVQFTAVELD